jgi:hypothetical protein
MIEIKEALTKKVKKDFYAFPQMLYKGNKKIAPVLIADEKDEFNPLKNAAFEFCIARQFVAYSDGKPVGRIGAIFNQKYNDKKNVKQMRFTRFDFIDDFEVSSMLIEKVRSWAEFLGMNEIIGPIGFSDLDKQGMLIEGFDEDDLYLTVYNYDYYPVHMEKLGFSKAVDWVEYEIQIPEKMDERLDKLADSIIKRYGYEVLHVKKFKETEPYIQDALLEIMNESYAPLFGVTPLNLRQVRREMEQLKLVFNPDFVLGVMHEGKMVGYGFMAPNITKAMRIFNGKINLRGICTLVRSLKKFDKVDLYSIGVKAEYQSKGVNALILQQGLKSLIKNGVRHVYTGPELEENQKVQSQWKGFERKQNRRRRCYTKTID